MKNELYHYGVPGMKWGVRKERTRTNPKRKKVISDKAAKRLKIGVAATGAVLAAAGAYKAGRIYSDTKMQNAIIKRVMTVGMHATGKMLGINLDDIMDWDALAGEMVSTMHNME